MLYSFKYLSIIMYFYSLTIGYCIIIHPMNCDNLKLWLNLLTRWCQMRMQPARLVSMAFLYTTNRKSAEKAICQIFQYIHRGSNPLEKPTYQKSLQIFDNLTENLKKAENSGSR